MRRAVSIAILALLTAAPVQAQNLLEKLETRLGGAAGALGAAPANPGYLGMVPDEDYKGGNGTRVKSVKLEGPADKSGLKADDLITAIDGKPIANVDEMDAALSTAVAGQKMLLTVIRAGKSQSLTVTLGTRPAAAAVSDTNPGEPPPPSPPGTPPPAIPRRPALTPASPAPLDPLGSPATAPGTVPPGPAPAAGGPIRSRPLDLGAPPAPGGIGETTTPPAGTAPVDPLPAVPAGSGASLGITVVPLSDEARAVYGLAARRGALITQIRPGSPADRAGLPLGALIVMVDGRRIDSADDLVGFIRTARPGQEVEMGYYEGDMLRRKTVRLGPTAVGMAPGSPSAPPPAVSGGGLGSVLGGGGDRPLLNRVEKMVDGIAGGRGPTVYDPSDMAALKARVAELTEQVKGLEERLKVLEGRGGAAPPAPALGGFTPTP